jgi:hypothetical protein
VPATSAMSLLESSLVPRPFEGRGGRYLNWACYGAPAPARSAPARVWYRYLQELEGEAASRKKIVIIWRVGIDRPLC